MREKRRGRPKLSNSDFQIVRSYRLPKKTWLEFKTWCEERGLRVSDVVRGSISLMMKEGSISELLEDEEMRSLAVELVKQVFRKE